MLIKIVCGLISVAFMVYGANILKSLIQKHVGVFYTLIVLVTGINLLAIFCNFSPWFWLIPFLVLELLQFSFEHGESIDAIWAFGASFAVTLIAALARVQDQVKNPGWWSIASIIVIPIFFELSIVGFGKVMKDMMISEEHLPKASTVVAFVAVAVIMLFWFLLKMGVII